MKTFNAGFGFALVLAQSLAWAGSDGMSNMPKIQPKKSYTVKNADQGDELLDKRGFGDEEPRVRMMNLMMVEGSGMEGMDMDMSGMKMAANDSKGAHSGHPAPAKSMAPPASAPESSPYRIELVSPTGSPKVGSNVIQFWVKSSKDDKPAPGLKPTAEVAMTSMDMGTEKPKVKETAPGKYSVKAPFSMKGPWALKLMFPGGATQVLNFDVGQ